MNPVKEIITGCSNSRGDADIAAVHVRRMWFASPALLNINTYSSLVSVETQV